MKIVSDSSPLIFLSKIDKLSLLEKHALLIPEEVYAEIKKGRDTEKEDYVKIEGYVKIGKIKVLHTSPLQDIPFTIGKGENEAVALALQTHADIILIDDKKGWKLAKLNKLNPKGTLAVLIEEYKKGRASFQETKQAFEKLLRAGFHIPEDKILSVLNELEKK
ncbi:hypothetical protein J4457_07230 [Candidatus Woesearchaeota archaeon]|nr:hypothetical protein [Candidatus Woesearchaeota archaeon]